jgi:hypothetical protein
MVSQRPQKSSRKQDKPLNFQQLHHFSSDRQMPENIEDDSSIAAITA